MKIDQATPSIVTSFCSEVEPKLKNVAYVEQAAQELAAALQSKFTESVVLARVFLTVSFNSLPEANRKFVQNLAQSAGAASALGDTTPVLSLIGTHGQETDWNDRRKSKGHVGIPLISSAFVGAIPMISRLLRELGVPIDWIDSHDSAIIKKAVGQSSGLFFVDDAGKATDNEGRKIIAAQDFVSAYAVKSVFGAGEAYSNGQMIVFVVFCRDAFSRDAAERFGGLTGLLKRNTASLVEAGKVFSD
jgi:hypothetical protein